MNTINRRNFLKLCSLSSLAYFLPGTTSAIAGSHHIRTLILIELKGGNDGLNTVIPYAHPRYQVLRPNIGINRGEVIQLDAQTGLHPSLEPLLDVWRAGDLAIIQGLGYENPNHSHFRSIAIWETGSGSDKVLNEGWLARHFHNRRFSPSALADSVILGQDAGPLAGAGMRNIVTPHLAHFIRKAKNLPIVDVTSDKPAMAHILVTQKTARQAAIRFEQIMSTRMPTSVSFPKNHLGRMTRQAVDLIQSGINLPVIKITHAGFDTHTHQSTQHARLLGSLASALAGCRTALTQSGDWDRVLIMTYSEFGRRASENGSRGTDHGTAAPHFLAGGRIRGGLYGRGPSLDHLNEGDLVYTADYRRLYNTVLRRWLGLTQTEYTVRRYPPFDCLA
jgi:uncharacterized protein (DUF1501 family)